MLIVHLFVSYTHVNLCHFFSSSWCQGLAATSACGSSWTFFLPFYEKTMERIFSLCTCNRLKNDNIPGNIYVPRKVRIGAFPELSCAKWEFSFCPPIPELYRTILELRNGCILKIGKVCVPAQSGNCWTK